MCQIIVFSLVLQVIYQSTEKVILQQTEKIKLIDLEKVIRDKNPKLLKWLPGFLLRYMKRIVHEKDFNTFLLNNRNKLNHEFINAAIANFEIELSSAGLENVPSDGGCIIVCNHPLGGLDGIAVMRELAKKRSDMKALVNDILMNLENMNSLLIPVNKHGKTAVQNMKLINQAYASDECTIVFPAGLVSRKQNGVVKDSEWTKSFVTKAVRHKQVVIPVHVDASNSNFFYNLASMRKMVGVKINLEMFYLVNETYKQKNKSINLTFGKPINYSSFTRDKSDYEWAQEVKEHVYSLKHFSSQFSP